jgi:hypothetical protein
MLNLEAIVERNEAVVRPAEHLLHLAVVERSFRNGLHRQTLIRQRLTAIDSN